MQNDMPRIDRDIAAGAAAIAIMRTEINAIANALHIVISQLEPDLGSIRFSLDKYDWVYSPVTPSSQPVLSCFTQHADAKEVRCVLLVNGNMMDVRLEDRDVLAMRAQMRGVIMMLCELFPGTREGLHTYIEAAQFAPKK